MMSNIFVLGGFENFIRTYFIRISINDSIINYTSILYYGSVTFIVFAFYHNEKSNWYNNFYLMFGVTFTLILSFFMGGRSLIVLLLLSFGYHWIRNLKTSRATLFISLAGIAIVFISYIIIDLRYQTQNTYYYSGDKGSGIVVATTGVVFADHVAASIEYAERKGHDYGALYRNLLLLPIPRSVWPEKPRQISVEMRDFIFQDVKGGIPPGIFGESYIAFGYPGMIAASLLLGLFLGLIDRRSKQADRTLCATTYATTAVMGPLVAFSLVRGGFDVGLMRVGIPLFWCMVAARIARILAKSLLQSRVTTDATVPPAVLRRREALSARSGISASQL
jgi:oligosaccharide repeat unit polymerase